MSNYPHSLVVVCPAAVKSQLLELGAALGVDGGMDVPLSADGSAPAIYYGSHSWIGPEFKAIITRAVYPDPLPAGVTTDAIDAILDECMVSVDPVVDDVPLTKRDHFNHVVSGLGLQVVTSDQL